jgi:uncharacterized protein
MSLRINLRHLENKNLVIEGDLPAAELDVDLHDDVIRVSQPLHYALEVQKLDESLLLRGKLAVTLNCQCVRCLKPFEYKLVLPDFTCLVPLSGEEAAPVSGDCVDLTPFLREDTLLEFPQHPLCKPGCPGLKLNTGKTKKSGAAGAKSDSTAWADLDKLKLQ